MKNYFIKGMSTALTSILAVIFIISNVFAASDTFDTDSSGNVFGAGDVVNVVTGASGEINNELFAAGMDVSANDVYIDGSAFVAGQSVTIKNSEVGASIFAAGNTVTIDAIANNNIWVAGNNIIVSEDTSVKGIHLAGNSVSVSGDYEGASICGSTVFFDAVVDGDVTIEADEITIGDNARVLGNLTITAPSNPDADSITEGDYTYEKPAVDTDDDYDGDEKFAVKKKFMKNFSKASLGLLLLKKIKKVVLGLIKYALLASVLAFVFKKNLDKSYEYATTKTGAFIGTGALVLFCLPIIALVLCITVVGIPVSGLALTFYVLSLCVAKVFTFASLARELIFKNAKKRLHPVLEAVIAVLPAAVLKEIPFIGGLLSLACAVYMLGYVGLAFYYTVAGEKETGTKEK